MTASRRRFLKYAAITGMSPSLANLLGRSRSSIASSRSWWPQPSRENAVELGFVGDLFLLESLPGEPVPETRAVAEILGSCDMAFANLENGLSTVGSPDAGGQKYGPSLRGPPSLVGELPYYGVGAVSLANNHTGNYGSEALVETMEILERAGIRHAGAGEDIEAAFAATVIPLGEIRVGFISVYSLYHEIEAEDLAGPASPGIAGSRAYDVVAAREPSLDLTGWSEDTDPPWLVPRRENDRRVMLAAGREDLDRLKTAIGRARADVDFLVLSVHYHWGRHLRSDIPHHQGVVGRAAVQAGADLVVGHGPHVLRGVEVHRGRPIVHSLGNFLLSPVEENVQSVGTSGDLAPARRSVMLRVGLADQRTHLQFIPIWIGADGRPRAGDGAFARETLRELHGLSASLGTSLDQRDGFGELVLGRGLARAAGGRDLAPDSPSPKERKI